MVFWLIADKSYDFSSAFQYTPSVHLATAPPPDSTCLTNFGGNNVRLTSSPYQLPIGKKRQDFTQFHLRNPPSPPVWHMPKQKNIVRPRLPPPIPPMTSQYQRSVHDKEEAKPSPLLTLLPTTYSAAVKQNLEPIGYNKFGEGDPENVVRQFSSNDDGEASQDHDRDGQTSTFPLECPCTHF